MRSIRAILVEKGSIANDHREDLVDTQSCKKTKQQKMHARYSDHNIVFLYLLYIATLKNGL